MKVALFVTCLVDQLFPEIGVSTLRLLRRLGCEVTFPKAQTCCGQPLWNSGSASEARSVARSWLAAFEGCEAIVTPSGSCAGMVTHHYAEVFADDAPARARALELGLRTFELSQFIVHVLGRTDLGARFSARATYHPSCHGMRLCGVRDEPLMLLGAVRELELVPLDHAEDCCGFGGLFAAKHAALSGAMVAEKGECVRASGARVLVGTDAGCLMNIAGFLRRGAPGIEPLHLAVLLDRATSNRGSHALADGRT